MAPQLSTGALAAIVASNGKSTPKITVQVLSLRDKPLPNTQEKRYRLVVSDGEHFIHAIVQTQLGPKLEQVGLQRLGIVELDSYVFQSIKGKGVVVVSGLEFIQSHHEKIGSPIQLYVNDDDANGNGNNGSANSTPASGVVDTKPSVNDLKPNNVSEAPRSDVKAPNVHPIESLSPYQNRWTIRARVSLKSEIRTWHNNRGEGKLFSVNFLDESGEIKATAFNDDVDRFYDLLEEGKVYYVSKCRVNIAKKQFTNVNHPYELMFGRDTVIQPAEDSGMVPKIQLNFVKLGKLQEIENNSIVDVIGIVSEVDEPSQIVSKTSGRPFDKRDITLVDDSKFSIRVTIWNKAALQFDSPRGTVVALKGAKVSDFNGKSLTMPQSGSLIINPDTTEAYSLKGWFDTGGQSEAFAGFQSEFVPGKTSVRKTIEEAKNEQLGMSEKPDYFSVKATVTYIKPENFAYPACQNEGCNRKVTEEPDGSWRCEKCDKVFAEPNWRYILQLSVSDPSGLIWISCFDEAGVALLGKSATELTQLRDNNNEAFTAVFQEAQGVEYLFRVKARQDSYQGQMRVRYQVTSLQALDYSAECDYVISQLKELLN